MEQLYSTLGEHIPDNLIAGTEIPILVKEIKIAKGQGVLLRGTVVGIISASGLAMPVDKTKSDGTQTAFGILTDTIDTAQTTDIVSTGYVSGLFNSAALIFGGTDTAVDHEAKLRELGIFLKENIEY
jgi:hypothetical protein